MGGPSLRLVLLVASLTVATAAGRITLAELAAAEGLTPPSRPSSEVPPAEGIRVLGARAYPFGVADPRPPPRSRTPVPVHTPRPGIGRTSGRVNTLLKDGDIYDPTRLPRTVIPTRYLITMSPNLGEGTFSAALDIYINVQEATSTITLHAVDLKIQQVEILLYSHKQKMYTGNGAPTITPPGPADNLERIYLELSDSLKAGDHCILRFPIFTGNLRDDGKGFYRSSYTDNNGQVRYLAATLFEPLAARYAFPCFDDPDFKARFKVTVEHNRDFQAMSNMPVMKISSPTLTTVRTEFDESPPMSTYLVAWLVSDFTKSSSSDGEQPNTVTVTTWGRSNVMTDVAAALADYVAPKALELLAEYTGIAYSLPKIDQVAIPGYRGARDNWGLVTYGEEYLIETNDTNIHMREFIGRTVCHELGNQWAGNLVTMDWWSNTWLNEGFGTYLESVICDKIFSPWLLMDKFVTDNVHVGIEDDVIPGQVAMSSPVYGATTIANKFDHISYEKAAAVLRMFEHVLGTEVFKKGLNRYLTESANGNGSPESLFRALDAEARLADSPLPKGVSFDALARSWTEQAGVPVVTATRDYTQSTVKLTQEQFFYERPDDHQDALWYVPIPAEANPSTKTPSWSMEDASANRRWLTPAEPSMSRDVEASASEWFVINPKQIGYYLVNYDHHNWMLLKQGLSIAASAFPQSTRAQLLHDAMALARGGRLDYPTALSLLSVLQGEREVAPWKAGVKALAFLRSKLTNTPASSVLETLIQDLVAEPFSDLGFSPNRSVAESYKDLTYDEERYLRYYVTSYACSAGYPDCVKSAVDELASALLGGMSVHPDIRDTVFCYGSQNSPDNYARVLEKWQSGEVAHMQHLYTAALSCTVDHSQISKVLDDILDNKTNKKPADLQQLLDAIISRGQNHKFILDYYMKNEEKIAKLTSDDYSLQLLLALIGDISTPEEYDQVESYVKQIFSDPHSTARKESELRLQAAKKGLQWYHDHYDTVSKWLFSNYNTDPKNPTGSPGPKPTAPDQTTESTTQVFSGSGHVTGGVALLLAGLLALLLH